MINWSPLSRGPGSHKAIKCVKYLPLTMPVMTTRMPIIPWFPLCITLLSHAGHEICCGKLFPPQVTALEEFPTLCSSLARACSPRSHHQEDMHPSPGCSSGKGAERVSCDLEAVEECGDRTGFILRLPRLTAPTTVRAADFCQFIC